MTATPLNTIEVLKTTINNSGGLQRSNRYSVSWTTGQGDKILPLYPVAISFGARAVDYIHDGLPGYGFGRMVPKSSKFVGGIVMSLPVFQNQEPFRYINEYFDYIYSSFTPINSTQAFIVPYYDDSVRNNTLTVNLLDLNGALKNKIDFTEAYPVECMPFELSAKSDQFLTYQVVFNYRQMKSTVTP
jgi:hypothetical protein